jgi:hypothetical protein
MPAIAAVGGAVVGGAAVDGAAGDIFPGSAFLPGSVEVYVADIGTTSNGTTFKQGDIVTVTKVTHVPYGKVLHSSDPTQNTTIIKVVYTTDGVKFAMVEMLHFLRNTRVVDANANATLMSIEPSYRQVRTHMKVQLTSLEEIPPTEVQVPAITSLLVSAPAPAPAPGIVLANAMQTVMKGLFAGSPQNTAAGNVQTSVLTHMCRTAKCSRFTWDGESGHCCRTCCSSGGSKHGVDCCFKDDAIDDYLIFTKKQNQQGGSRGDGGA